MVPKIDGQTAYKRQLAYARIGVDPTKVERMPFLASELRRIARVVRGVDLSHGPSPTVRPLELLQSSDDPEARRVSEVYRSVPESYRRLLPAEAFCHAAGVSPWRVLELIAGVAVRQGAQASTIIAAIMQPRVLEKTVERALRDDGFAERKMLHKATGFLPANG